MKTLEKFWHYSTIYNKCIYQYEFFVFNFVCILLRIHMACYIFSYYYCNRSGHMGATTVQQVWLF